MKKFLGKVLAISIVAGIVASLGLTASAEDLFSEATTNKGNMHLVSSVSYYKEGDTFGTFYKYDENDLLIEEGDGETADKVTYKFIYEYNEDGTVAKYTEMDYDSETSKWATYSIRLYEYNVAGQQTKESIQYNEGGTFYTTFVTENEYNSDGTVAKYTETNYNNNGDITSIYEKIYEYNDKKQMINEEDISYNNQHEATTSTYREYKYDENGNLTGEIYMNPNSSGQYVNNSKFEYTYDDHNNKASFTSYFYNEGEWLLNIKQVYECKYSGDSLISIISKQINTNTGEEEPQEKYTYEYDKYGNTIAYVSYYWKSSENDWEKSTTHKYTYESNRVKITNGTKQKINVKSTKEAVFTSNADILDFKKVTVDGKDVDAKYYTVKSGSTIVTISQEYLKKLANGEHKLVIVSETGNAETTFTISGADSSTTSVVKSPKTGDTMEIALLSTLLIACAFACTLVLRKKEN